MKQICVVGVGYVGLVTGACFADLGNKVVALDVDEKRIENLKKGIMPIYEPGLDELVKRNVQPGRLSFTTSYAEAIKGCRVCIHRGRTLQRAITAKRICNMWKPRRNRLRRICLRR